jgi:predicted ATP-binding protein involved in virulence
MTIAEDAQRLIQLNDRIKQELPPLTLALTEFGDGVFSEVLDIIGNVHDPLVIDASTHIRYAQELLQDYVKDIHEIRKRIKSTGYKLMRLQ